jgi:hypothetical protein
MHNHNCGCNHDLAYCGHCDVVYCKKCGKEWKYNFYNYIYPYTSPWTYATTTKGYNNPTVSYSSSTDTTQCTHHGKSTKAR